MFRRHTASKTNQKSEFIMKKLMFMSLYPGAIKRNDFATGN